MVQPVDYIVENNLTFLEGNVDILQDIEEKVKVQETLKK